MSIKATFFDIETGALPESEIKQFMPEEKPFDEKAVKTGNLKDPAKIAEKLAEAKYEHENAQRRARFDFLDKAALSATTGRILAVGVLQSDFRGTEIFHGEDEKKLLGDFWHCYRNSQELFVSFNGNNFDLPFLIRRSWKLGVPVPVGLRRGRYWNDRLIDLRETWGCGEWQPAGSLDLISKFLGLGEKNGHGSQFAKLYYENQPAALDYLRNDLELLENLFGRIYIG